MQEDAKMGVWESLLAPALIGALLYVGDRGIAFHVCLYSSIASGGKFTAEQAYRAMRNPFATPSKLVLAATFILLTYLLGHRGGIRADWQVIAILIVALCYVCVSAVAAVKAFRRTQFSKELR